MHTVFGIRGIKQDVENFIEELSTRYVSFKMFNEKAKKMESKLVRLRVCPVQIFDVSFPKEHADAVLSTIYSGGKGKTISRKLRKYAKLLRVMLGLKDLPKYKTESHLMMSYPENIEVIALGVKEDLWIREDGKNVKEKDKTELSTEGI